jgi:hypothetical protein
MAAQANMVERKRGVDLPARHALQYSRETPLILNISELQ